MFDMVISFSLPSVHTNSFPIGQYDITNDIPTCPALVTMMIKMAMVVVVVMMMPMNDDDDDDDVMCVLV